MRFLRQLYAKIVVPFASVTTAQDRIRSEVLVGLALIRQVLLTSLFVVYVSRGLPNLSGLFIAAVLNVGFYFMARSRHYKLAAALIITEPMILISRAAIHGLGPTPDLETVHRNAQLFLAPSWLAVGPIIACLVLPLSWAFTTVIATAIAFLTIYLNVDPYYQSSITAEFGYTMALSCFAFLGAGLRARADRALEVEQGKVLQSAKLASLGEMASGVAHELNTPLGTIMLTVELAQAMAKKKDARPSDLNPYLTEIDEISQRMARIIRGMKDFSRDGSEADFEWIESRKWIEDAMRLGQQRFRSASVRLELVRDNLLLQKFSAQPTQLSQVLLNLLSNAFDAVHDEPEKWVRVSARTTEDGFFELLVEDSGRGISDEVIEKLFQPFFTTKGYGRGTGLGLSISKGIARRHGGDLFVDTSAANTRFVLRLPLADPRTISKVA